MKKYFKYYAIVWATLLILFNAIAFLSVGWEGQEKYTSSFWIGYVLISITFIGQIVCTHHALKDDNLTKTFYNLSLLSTSYTGLILSFVIGGLCMLLSALPVWVGGILCVAVLMFNIISVTKAVVAIETVSAMDDKLKERTSFVRTITAEAKYLMDRAKTKEAKDSCKKIYELLRYSDSMSNPELKPLEDEIVDKLERLSTAIDTDDEIGVLAGELAKLIEKRNKRCKLLK